MSLMVYAGRLLRSLGVAALLLLALRGEGFALRAQTTASKDAAPAPGVLGRDQAAAILPPSVFFRGQSATIQARNSAGVRLADGKLVLTAIVDTSGYSTGLAQSYQAYLITEVPLQFGGQTLKPGAYGYGFVAGDRVVVMDIGGNEIMHASTLRDSVMARPTPLQIVSSGAGFRLYLGRNYIAFEPVASAAR